MSCILLLVNYSFWGMLIIIFYCLDYIFNHLALHVRNEYIRNNMKDVIIIVLKEHSFSDAFGRI